MKKIIVAAVSAFIFAGAATAQEMPERKHDGVQRKHASRERWGKSMQDLQLTEDQKSKLKDLNASHRQDLENFRKQDNITVKQSREKMAGLRQDHQAKFNSILTDEQRAKLDKSKKAREAKMKEMKQTRGDRVKSDTLPKGRGDRMTRRGGERGERLEKELNLSSEQQSKITEGRKASAEKMKAVRADNSLSEDQKEEKIRAITKEQREQMRSVLTEEQKAKLDAQQGERKVRTGRKKA